MNVSDDSSTITILDEHADAGAAAASTTFSQASHQAAQAKGKRTLRAQEGSFVLAMFPETTMLYRAVVVQTPRWQGKNGSWGPYSWLDGGEDPNNRGYSINRQVAFSMWFHCRGSAAVNEGGGVAL